MKQARLSIHPPAPHLPLHAVAAVRPTPGSHKKAAWLVCSTSGLSGPRPDGRPCQESCTRVEEDNGTQAAQLRLVHLHVPHLGHELCQHPAEEAGKHHGLSQTVPLTRAPPPQKDPQDGLGRLGGDREQLEDREHLLGCCPAQAWGSPPALSEGGTLTQA